MDEVVIPGRFNGPLESGNGGYSSGAFAALVEGSAAVDLRAKVPLDTTLAVDPDGDGGVRVTDGETLIAEVRPAPPLALAPPAPVDIATAREACGHYAGATTGEFSQCFVCGLAREDSLGVFAGPVAGREVVATPWTAPDWTGDSAGAARPELVWSVLDCPTVFAAFIGAPELPLAFLAHYEVAERAPVAVGEEHVVIGWPLRHEGRKHWAGSAILSGAGETLAVAEALIIEPRPA